MERGFCWGFKFCIEETNPQTWIPTWTGTEKEPRIDTIVLACTHYPILKHSIEQFLPKGVKLFDQGDLVALKLNDYLKRHSKIDNLISKNGKVEILTSESSEKFDDHLNLFYEANHQSKRVQIS